jgi:hypothetical protein
LHGRLHCNEGAEQADKHSHLTHVGLLFCCRSRSGNAW